MTSAPSSPVLSWIDFQRDQMIALVSRWAEVNSGSQNLSGIERLAKLVEAEFGQLGGVARRHELPAVESVDPRGNVVRSPSGQALTIVKRPEAPYRVLLNIHLDTVYGPEHPFQQVDWLDEKRLRGPGVADAKGGLVVMLTALRALEQSDVAEKIGWEVLLNPDEETGSLGSAGLLAEAAKRNHVGLLFEPARPDGSLIGARKGSGNFTFVFRGRAAHVGRDFQNGRSAILAMADLVNRLEKSFEDIPGAILNCGLVEGGSAVNAVADLAIARVNARASTREEAGTIERRLKELVAEVAKRDGITVQLHGGFHSPPKPMDGHSLRLFELTLVCAHHLDIKLEVHPSGGACDGNKLVAAGLPVVDTLGPCGGNTHSDQEYVLVDTLTERAKLTTMILLKLASGQFRP